MELNEDTKQNLHNMILIGILAVIGGVFPLLISLSSGGLLEAAIFQQLAIYGYFAAFCLFGIFIFGMVRTTEAKQNREFGESIAFNSIGKFPSPKIPFIKNSMGLFFLSLFIFGAIGLFKISAGSNVGFTGVPFLQEQFTPFDNTLFSLSLVPISENAGAALLGAAYLFLIGYWARKYKWSKANYVVLAFVGFIVLFLLYTVVLHELRYGNSDVSLGNVAIFWALGGFITILTGSIIPFLVAHGLNNLLLDMLKYFSSDLAKIIFVILILISAYFYYFFTFRKKKETKVIE
jgi:hypothetical protein